MLGVVADRYWRHANIHVYTYVIHTVIDRFACQTGISNNVSKLMITVFRKNLMM